MLRAVIEFIFMLLGGLIVWLGLTGHIFFDRRRPAWLVLSIAVLIWGARALYRPGKYWSRWEDWSRGARLWLRDLCLNVSTDPPHPVTKKPPTRHPPTPNKENP